MDKLIVTCCVFNERPGNFWPPEALVNMPRTIPEVAESIRGARDAGAASVHVHVPRSSGGAQGSPFIKENYLELLRLIRQTDVIYEYRGPGPYQCGYAGRTGFDRGNQKKGFTAAEWEARLKEWRAIDLGDDKPDMVNCILGPQHMEWGDVQNHVMPTLAEMEDHMKFLMEKDVKPEFEVWGANSLYNLRHLIKKGLVNAPYWLQLFFGVYGPTCPPANVEELLYFMKKLPEGSMWFVPGYAPPRGQLTPQEMLVFYTQAITLGGHVRVGMEGCPYYWDGTPAKSNAQIIERIVRIARDIGREVATPDEAREMLGMPPRRK